MDSFYTHTHTHTHHEALILHRNDKPILRKKRTESILLQNPQLLFCSTNYQAGPRMNKENFVRKNSAIHNITATYRPFTDIR
jgi:hypothetical protein